MTLCSTGLGVSISSELYESISPESEFESMNVKVEAVSTTLVALTSSPLSLFFGFICFPCTLPSEEWRGDCFSMAMFRETLFIPLQDGPLKFALSLFDLTLSSSDFFGLRPSDLFWYAFPSRCNDRRVECFDSFSTDWFPTWSSDLGSCLQSLVDNCWWRFLEWVLSSPPFPSLLMLLALTISLLVEWLFKDGSLLVEFALMPVASRSLVSEELTDFSAWRLPFLWPGTSIPPLNSCCLPDTFPGACSGSTAISLLLERWLPILLKDGLGFLARGSLAGEWSILTDSMERIDCTSDEDLTGKKHPLFSAFSIKALQSGDPPW